MIESPFLQFLWMVQGHLSLVHDLKKEHTKGDGWKHLPVWKHEISMRTKQILQVK